MEPVQPPRKSGVSLIGAFFGMLITFLSGIYVGAHPTWFPSRWLNSQDENSGKPSSTPTLNSTPTTNDERKSTTQATTAPAMVPATLP